MDKKPQGDFTFCQNRGIFISALALSVVLSGGVFKIYYMPLLYFCLMVLFAAAICTLIFFGIEKCLLKGFFGKLIITLFIVADIYLFYIVTMGGSFRENLFFADRTTGTSLHFMLGLLVSVPVFCAVTVYYFSCVRYRMCNLVLISLMSCVLYVKNVQEVDNFFVALFVMLNFVIYAEHRLDNYGKLYAHKKSNRILSLMPFLCMLVLIVSFIPKDNEAKYYDKFRQVFMNYNITSPLGSDYSNLSNASGNADNYQNAKNRRMFTLWGSEPVYLKKQNFDYYDFDKDVWYADEDYNNHRDSVVDWRYSHQWLNLTALQMAIKNAEELSPGFAEKYHLENIADNVFGNIIRDNIGNVYIQSHNFSAAYYLVPPRCTEVVQENSNPEPMAAKNGTFVTKEGMHGKNTTYRIACYSDIKPRKQWIEMGAANFALGDSSKMLYELADILRDEDNMGVWHCARVFLRESQDAQHYNFICRENTAQISEEIKELAEKITQNCVYDYEKAEALQNYFQENGFIYDLEYIADDTSPEYFLFESKRGTCSDFASAYVLMARSVGLTVRYAEGFVPEKTPIEGAYAVTDITAHAYPEVFIENFGWTVYEPTVASPYNSFGNVGWSFSFGNLNVDFSMVGAVSIIVLCVALCVLTVKVFIPVVDEMLFLYSIKKKAPDVAVAALHKRLAQKNVWNLISNGVSLTPYEIAEQVKSLTGFELQKLALYTERAAYEGVELSENDKNEAITLYNALKKLVKKQKHKK